MKFFISYYVNIMLLIIAALCMLVAQGFTSTTTTSTRQTSFVTSPLSATPPGTFEELMAMPDLWNPIKETLNKVPAFACANEEGQPLQYKVGESPLAFFYLDVSAAKEELKKAVEESKVTDDLKLSLMPFPLGECVEMGAKQMALIIPSQESLEAAGAPKGTNPMGQQVPLFGCMALVENLDDGSTRVPLFLDSKEADEAMSQALQGVDEETRNSIEVTVMPLAAAIQTQARDAGKRSFNYVAPQTSFDYLKSM